LAAARLGTIRARYGVLLPPRWTMKDGTPPKRFVIIGFDNVEKAKAWDASAAQKEVNDIRMKNTKSRSFIVAVEGM
jgi:uncharacterized protein (DUF1330 family)